MPEFDYQKQAQDYYSKAPLIVLGSGASAAYGMPGMQQLADHLITNTDIVGLLAPEIDTWYKFCQVIKNGTDLESALHQVPISENLTGRIINTTWTFINSHDKKIFLDILENNPIFPLSRLIEHMFRSSLNKVDIVTTNYDRLAEYACDIARFYHYTGFSHGFLRQFSSSEDVTVRRRVNIWKVHGSLDWFQSPMNDIVSIVNNVDLSDGYEPQIVTPGTQKYQRTHLEPFRSIINNADQSIVNANSYLCIGYGFNDEHIQPKLVAKCIRKKTPITIITYSLSDNVRRLILQENSTNYIAIERGKSDSESIIHSSLVESPISVDKNIWSLEGFLSLVM